MFNNIVENAVNLNNSKNNVEVSNNTNKLVSVLVAVVVVLVLNLVVGPFLWNEVMRKLVPVCGRARWFDTVALMFLLSLVLPRA